jgi:hypothetical protein
VLRAGELCVELFAGSFGWSAGWLSLGGRAIGFDIEHLPHHGAVPEGASLVLQDVTTLHGSQFKDASLILASPPCTEYSYMAMPWKRAKQIIKALRGEGEFPEGYTGSRTVAELNRLFDACFRIQREACEAAGRYIPMVVENVRGAQPWVGKARAWFGSFYLWGDVGMVGKRVVAGVPRFGVSVQPMKASKVPGFRFNGVSHGSFQTASVNQGANGTPNKERPKPKPRSRSKAFRGGGSCHYPEPPPQVKRTSTNGTSGLWGKHCGCRKLTDGGCSTQNTSVG